MAKSKNSVKSSEIKKLLSQNEFAIGVFTIIIVLILGAISLKQLSRNLSINAPGESSTQLSNNQIKENKTSTNSATMTPSAMATPSAEKVKNLSYTSSYDRLIIKNGDSYFRITKRFCGTGKLYKLVAEINGKKPLYQGDSIIISCSF